MIIRKKLFELSSDSCRMSVFIKDDDYTIEFDTGLKNSDPDSTVSYVFNETLLNHEWVRSVFHDNVQMYIFDQKQNVGIEIGSLVDGQVEVYFELLDYSLDGVAPASKKYTLKVDKSNSQYASFNELAQRIAASQKMRLGGTKDGIKPNTFKHHW